MHGAGVLLLGMVAGYWVLERAAGHKGRLKQIGQAVGAIVLVASLLGLACKAWYVVSGGSCPMGKKGFCSYPMARPNASDASK